MNMDNNEIIAKWSKGQRITTDIRRQTNFLLNEARADSLKQVLEIIASGGRIEAIKKVQALLRAVNSSVSEPAVSGISDGVASPKGDAKHPCLKKQGLQGA